MKFICPEHGEIIPVRLGYSFPMTGWCPHCDKQLQAADGGLRIMTEEEANKARPGYTRKTPSTPIEPHD